VSYSNLEVARANNHCNTVEFQFFGLDYVTRELDSTSILRLRNLKTLNLTDVYMTNDVFDRVYDTRKIPTVIHYRQQPSN
jgi:hypothetical protein